MPKPRIFEKLVPLQLKVEPNQKEALSKEAQRLRISMSEYMRQIIDHNIINRPERLR